MSKKELNKAMEDDEFIKLCDSIRNRLFGMKDRFKRMEKEITKGCEEIESLIETHHEKAQRTINGNG